MEEMNVLFVGGKQPDIIIDKLFSGLPTGFNLDFYHDKSREEKERLLEKADIIMGFPHMVSSKELIAATNLRMVQILGAGYDYFDVETATELGIFVANNGGANAIAVAEHTILLILSLYKKLFKHLSPLKKGIWHREQDHPVTLFELANKTVGIIGFGNIGKALAKRLKGFEVEAKYSDVVRYPHEEQELSVIYTDLEQLLETSDVVTVHVPLQKSTRNLMGKNELRLMKKSAILINTSRGEVVDEEALYKALKDNRIAGAGLDVFHRENDLKRGTYASPLLALENVVATPHYAGHTYDTWLRRIKVGYENIMRLSAGKKPKHLVNEIAR